MKFRLIVDKSKEEAITATVHQKNALTDEIELLVMNYNGSSQVVAYTEDEMKILSFSEISCIAVFDSKTYAVGVDGTKYRIKQKLYEVEKTLPASFIRINKSAIANKNQIEKFSATFSGAVDVYFKCGYKDYVSRRCFSEIKRRYKNEKTYT